MSEWMPAILYIVGVIQFGFLFLTSGFLTVLMCLIGWSVVWVPIAFVHNLFTGDAGDWSYLGFWAEFFSGMDSATVANQVHLNIALGIGNLLALVGLATKAKAAKDTEKSEEKPQT